MLAPKELCEKVSSLFDDNKTVTINDKDDWVFGGDLGNKAKIEGLDYTEYDCTSFFGFLKCFKGIECYKDTTHDKPLLYFRREGQLYYIKRHPTLSEWASMGDYLATYEDLRELALEENWGDYTDDTGRTHYPILENYLNYTFQKLYSEKGILFSHDNNYAAFNTGLVDCRYLPIYALFCRKFKKWAIVNFCISGENYAGKILNSEFEHMPPLPKYFNSINDLLYDTNKGLPALDLEHIILERTSRLPYDFIKTHVPRGFKLKPKEELKELNLDEKTLYFQNLATAISSDQNTYRSYSTALQNALAVAIKRVQWNYKSAIPMYYPVRKKMCLFLPLCLVHDNKVDLALVVERMNSGRYQGSTVYPLDWAYKCARLICRPDSDWLTPYFKDQDLVDDN